VRKVLEELAVVDHGLDDLVHVVGQVRAVGQQCVELGAQPVGVVGVVVDGGLLEVVRR